MRITPQLFAAAQTTFDPLGSRTIFLTHKKIEYIENLAACPAHFDTFDLSHNRIERLPLFPAMPELKVLRISNNAIARVDEGWGVKCPQLHTIIAARNQLGSFAALSALLGAHKLRMLDVSGSAVARRPHFFAFALVRCPTLAVVNWCRVTTAHRRDAAALCARGVVSSCAAEMDELYPDELPQPAPVHRPAPPAAPAPPPKRGPADVPSAADAAHLARANREADDMLGAMDEDVEFL